MSKINKKLLYLDEIFPIGKTEIFFDNNDHSNYMGFTWQRTAVGKAIVGIDPNDTDFNSIGKTGGSKYIQDHEHTWGGASGFEYVASAPSWINVGSGNTSTARGQDTRATTGGVKTGSSGVSVGNSGNLQPYEVFAIWVRTA